MSRGVTIFIELSGPFQGVPGYFSGSLEGGRFRRIWWLWFAVAVVPLPLDRWARMLERREAVWG